MILKDDKNKQAKKVLIIVSGFSPHFNHIPSVRIAKLAKFLSRHLKVYVVGGLPKNVTVNKNIDAGNAEIINIEGIALNKSNLSGSAQKNVKRDLRLKIKILLGPIIMFFLPLSSGGGIFYRKREFISSINNIISKYKSNEVILLTSYNPWFAIQIGKHFKKRYKDIYWVNDYRDLPFNNIVEPLTKFIFFKIASKFYTDISDLTLCVTKEIQNNFKSIAKDPKKILYYPNGYDLDDLPPIKKEKATSNIHRDNHLVITYTGRFYQNGTREITPFIRALASASNNKNFKFLFKYAGSQAEYVKNIFSEFGLSDSLEILGVISREEAIKLQSSSDMLLLISYTGENDIQGDGIVTGKFFEYALTKRPIMVIGSSGWELKKVLLGDKLNSIFRHSETSQISNHLIFLMNAKNKTAPLKVAYSKKDFDSYNHKKLAENLLEKFKNI
jgi:hypothetical protein